MSFSGTGFLFFLPLALALHAVVPPGLRWVPMIATGYLFYASLMSPWLLVGLALATALAYGAGLAMPRLRGGAVKAVFWAATLGLLGILAAFRVGSAGDGPGILGILTSSVGISFIAFQAISYLADVYLGRIPAERHAGHFAASMAFFPKLLQGPIERTGTLIPQVKSPTLPDASDISDAAVLFLSGLFRKVVVADALGAYVDGVFGNLQGYSGWPLAAAVYLYALQIYFDFSGYTNMALGVGRLFGIRLTDNFNKPYLAISIGDFWRRWHISLSSWILDYLFRPMQMSLRKLQNTGNALALLITFALCGLWHGFSLTFLAWGTLHGTYMAMGALTQKRQRKLYKAWGIDKSKAKDAIHAIVTFHMVCLGWILFRSATLGDAWYVVTRLVTGGAGQGLPMDMSAQTTIALLFGIGAIALEAFGVKYPTLAPLGARNRFSRWAVCYAMAIAVYLLGVSGVVKGFVYGQF